MSLLTTLAYAITAAVRPRVRDAEVAALQAKVDDLRRELNDARLLLEATRPLRRAQVDREMAAQQQINREAQTLQAYAMMQQANAQAHQLSMQNGPYIGQRTWSTLGRVCPQLHARAARAAYARLTPPGRGLHRHLRGLASVPTRLTRLRSSGPRTVGALTNPCGP